MYRETQVSLLRWVAALTAFMICGLFGYSEPPDGGEGTAASSRKERSAQLRAEIKQHDALYFQHGRSAISDAAYDRLRQELRELERLSAASPEMTGSFDDLAGRRPTGGHRERMLSLAKAYTLAELRSFHAAVLQRLARAKAVFVVEPKYDGVAVSLVYEHGRLVRALTRGNGTAGEDVTVVVAAIRELSLQLSEPVPEFLELRAEVYVNDAEFTRLNRLRTAAGLAAFAHPRNLAAGTLKSFDAGEVEERCLALVVHGWGAWSGGDPPASQQEFQRLLESWGLPGVTHGQAVSSVDEIWEAAQAMAKGRSQLGFPIDGVVVKLDDTAGRRMLGASEQAPHWAIACKFQSEIALTRLRAITIQVGRTGVLTPVAELDPVILDGVQIRRATLHNRLEIERGDYRPGDFVEIKRAGEVIPAVVRALPELRTGDSEPFQFPASCPSCDAEVERKSSDAALRCHNPSCPAQRQRRLEHFASKQGVGLAGFGPATIERLVASGALDRPVDYYRLSLADLERAGFGRERARRMLATVEASKDAELWRFIAGLGIPQIGTTNSRRLAERYGDLARFAQLSEGDARRVVSSAAASSLAEFLAEPEEQADLAALIAAGVRPRKERDVSGPLVGKTFVFTGVLPAMSRAEAGERVRRVGGTVQTTVSRGTDYVVAGDGAGQKRAEAETLGIQVLDAEAFNQLIP